MQPKENRFINLPDSGRKCPVCGSVGEETVLHPITDALAADWELSPAERRLFDAREGRICDGCGSSPRLKAMAQTILSALEEDLGLRLRSFTELDARRVKEAAANLRIAEVNNLSALHGFLQGLPGLRYSEYGSKLPEVPSEDLMRLSYGDGEFDMILMTDVLEHVPDVRRALSEVRRTLRPGGRFIFTVPILFKRDTRKRADIAPDGSVNHLLPPSYHGVYEDACNDLLVFWEFGGDFVGIVEDFFETRLCKPAGFGGEICAVFSCRKAL